MSQCCQCHLLVIAKMSGVLDAVRSRRVVASSRVKNQPLPCCLLCFLVALSLLHSMPSETIKRRPSSGHLGAQTEQG
ncbi:uncharacterized protein BO80DRAFT_204202 [Aspergillus ibericus CBS 121593]|uniref:Uncharacterized protein n=1 Tax=Aspergillus ibericus CBS 121593 TaxID=1448316 RepID=A0A395HAD0_9EURO|nr:hypothetical protein BO80DRAFT_204202 [Aspergillus ibericus CBS 121593]RAL04596.1 hypothetical protein BO80DRAFT_204202 [Aspergillus ibericus CBS 121593]